MLTHETIRCIRRCGLPPCIDQIGARHRQQQQRHQPDRERNQLDDRGHRSSLHGGDRESPRDAELSGQGSQRCKQFEYQPRHQRKHHQPACKAASGQAADLQIVGRPQQQREEADQSGEIAERHAPGRQPDVFAQYAQRWYVAQLRQRRQREAEQQHQSARKSLRARQQRRLRQRRSDQRTQRIEQYIVRRVAQRHADDACRQADHDELQREQPEDVGLRETEAAHHRARIQVPQRKTARRGRDRHCGDHCRQQRDQCQKSLGTVERALHLGAAAFKRLDTLPAMQAFAAAPPNTRATAGRSPATSRR